MSKRQLKQIKIFKISDYDNVEILEKEVNNYVVEIFNKEGNYPNIQTNSKYIIVSGDRLVNTDS